MNKSEDGAAGLSNGVFHGAFSRLSPAILEEWSTVDAPALASTGGDYDKVVALIAERTAPTKVLVRRQLEEIYRVLFSPAPVCFVWCPGRAATGDRPATSDRAGTIGRDAREAAAAVGDAAQGALNGALGSVDEIMEEIEKKTAKLMRELRGSFVSDARGKVRENLLFSLLVTLGLGFIIGVLFNGLTRGK